jgi:hypothetical protein
MAKKQSNIALVKKILEHCDREEIIGRLLMGSSPADVHSGLAAKYTSVGEKKLVLSERSLKIFAEQYLDVYELIQNDLAKTKKALATNTMDELSLTLQGNTSYQKIMTEMAGKELNVRDYVIRLITMIETRMGRLFDIAESTPDQVNSRLERVLIEWANSLRPALEAYYRFTESNNDVNINVNQHISIELLDQQTAIFQSAIRDTLSEIDIDASMLFMQKLTEKLSALKLPSSTSTLTPDMKLAEAKILNETISKKLSLS